MKWVWKQCDKYDSWYWNLPVGKRMIAFSVMLLPPLISLFAANVNIWFGVYTLFHTGFIWLLLFNKMINKK